MKKTYLQPSIGVETMEAETFICGSQDIISDPVGITYGGVDEDGTKDPASRRFEVWDDEPEENW